jgi:hypothetical protein
MSEREKATQARLASRDTEQHPSVHDLNRAYNENRKADLNAQGEKHAAITAAVNHAFGIHGHVVVPPFTGAAAPVASPYAEALKRKNLAEAGNGSA